MDSLQLAINTLPMDERTDGYKDGLAILRDHATNYGEDGPQKLALLWWEWDPQHWTDLRVGVSMNFMEAPLAELVANLILVKVLVSY